MPEADLWFRAEKVCETTSSSYEHDLWAGLKDKEVFVSIGYPKCAPFFSEDHRVGMIVIQYF